MLIAIVPVLVAIVGVLMFALASNAKLSKIGFALFWCGVLVALFVAAHQTITVG